VTFYAQYMTEQSKLLFKSWASNPFNRRALFGAALVSLFASSGIGRALGATEPTVNLILGRPTKGSISISALASEKVKAYIEYGYLKSRYSNKSTVVQIDPATPYVFEISGLKSNTKVYYRIQYMSTSSSAYSTSKQYSFTTPRNKNTTFSFSVQGDTHPERAGKMFNAELYSVTMANVLSQQPDFHILLGDDFSIDPLIDKGQANQENVEKVYSTHRNWLSIAGNSVPIFLVNGNHEQAAAYLLDGTTSNPAVLAGNARNKYYPLPAPNTFYSGDQTKVDGVGLLRDYYAWEWGDALFLSLDPYWHSKFAVDNVAGVSADESAADKKAGGKGGGAKATNLWTIGIGDEQYAWLKKTLETSSAKYKFVFAHHVLGTGRGGVEVSTNYEWGGADPKGISTFAKERPNWALPIHDLMVKNGVSIFFQGHDHIFVHQERDGLVYQSMPNPADDTFSMFNEAAYKTGTKAPNSGHVKVTVAPTEAKVEYFLAARSVDSNRKNLEIAHSYTVKPGVRK
jgi:Calcineurin-like phosphoesterase